MVGQGAKLALLWTLELGVFPIAAGVWLELCALPLTAPSSTLGVSLTADPQEQQQPSAAAAAAGGRGPGSAPVLSTFMHWVLGVGFLLGFTFLVCVVREVLRRGALPFVRDPMEERNLLREMMQDPLIKHLGRIGLSTALFAGEG